jgi:hypothetical protein
MTTFADIRGVWMITRFTGRSRAVMTTNARSDDFCMIS